MSPDCYFAWLHFAVCSANDQESDALQALKHFNHGRTQGGVLGLKTPLELDILQKLYNLRKSD